MNSQGSNPGDSIQPEGWSGKPCPHCGSSDFATGVNLTQTGQVRLSLGLAYKAAGIFTGAEMLYADLCRGCGSVLRFFVKNPKRNWMQS
jgi:hypothetical protein